MKKLLYILTIVFAFGCNSEDAPDCLKSAGERVTRTVVLADFDQLYINNDFNVLITQGDVQNVAVTIGENLFKEIDFEVIEGELHITNHISCRWVRKYDFPTINITVPIISKIEITGGSVIQTVGGPLNVPSIELRSQDCNGDFYMDINSNDLIVWSNEISNFILTGQVYNLTVSFTSGDGLFKGDNLLTTNATVFHNGTNTITVNVSNELKGNINSTGNLKYVGNVPVTIDVKENGRGHLINGSN